MKLKIKFETFDQVKEFFNEINMIESDAIVRTIDKRYAVDAKSLMGIFSLDLSNDLILEIYGNETRFAEKIESMNFFVETMEV